jgi:hypothetical protein
MMYDDKYVGWLIDIRRDDGVGVSTWFDNEADAIEYEDAIWERGYIEGETPPEDGKKILRRYPIAKCMTARFELDFEHYAQGRTIKGESPYTTTYDWRNFEEYLDHKEWNDKKEATNDPQN